MASMSVAGVLTIEPVVSCRLGWNRSWRRGGGSLELDTVVAIIVLLALLDHKANCQI